MSLGDLVYKIKSTVQHTTNIVIWILFAEKKKKE